jgi:hypothetical protein
LLPGELQDVKNFGDVLEANGAVKTDSFLTACSEIVPFFGERACPLSRWVAKAGSPL